MPTSGRKVMAGIRASGSNYRSFAKKEAWQVHGGPPHAALAFYGVEFISRVQQPAS
jgi:hypothetical protein